MKSWQNFIRKIGSKLPIFQAPTGGVAGPELAIAVSNAGAVGALGLTWHSPAQAAAEVSAVREKCGTRPFQVNFVLGFPSHSLEAALDSGAPLVTFSWGMPDAEVDLVRRKGANIGIQVATPAAARMAAQRGADFLVCQGFEAGGHVQSSQPLHELLPRVLEAAETIPVLAAGGIGNGTAIHRVMKLGAAGAVLGTRFVASTESRAHAVWKSALVQAAARDTSYTLCFDGGWPYAAHRVLRNSTLENWEAAGCPQAGKRPGEGIIGRTADGAPIRRYDDTSPKIGTTGDWEAMCQYAGTSCEDIHEILPAAEIVRQLQQEWETAQRV